MKFFRGRKFSSLAVALIAAMVLAGCAGTITGSTATTGETVLPDGSKEFNTATHTEVRGIQTVNDRSYLCPPAETDETGQTVAWKDCALQANTNAGGDTPEVGITKAVLNNAAAGVAIGVGAAGAGALTRPSKTTVHGSSATTGASTAKSASGSTSTGALTGSGASVTNTVSNP